MTTPTTASGDANYGSTTDNNGICPYQLQESASNDESNTPENLTDHNNNDDDDEGEMSLTELLYSSSSYNAIAKPVSLTMILAALSVIFINDEESALAGQEAMTDAYTVWSIDTSGDGNTTGQNLARSLGNALVMVTVICCMTFVIVALYKCRCMKLLIGYMIFASAMLLGLLGGTVFVTAINVYRIPISKPTFYLLLWNFAIVGVYSVFYAVGVPTYVSQGYLICTSVILAWQLAHFDEWTAWTLLIALALYDLCAVLTPCGPLKALVNAMSEDDAPEMPGLLYEAELPPEARRPGVPSRATRQTRSDVQQGVERTESGDGIERTPSGIGSDRSVATKDDDNGDDVDSRVAAEEDGPTTELPLAIARVYNLPIVSMPTAQNNPDAARVSTSPLLETDDIPENPTPAQLRTLVTVRLPAQGGRIERNGRGRVYLERDRFGTPKRTLWVDRKGKVFAEAVESDDSQAGGGNSNSIRLGLGDFIFYSVLVAKAAQYSFATFISCMLVILAGLGGTLVLLSVFHHALPALPISIFLGVVFYVLTRLLLEPWMEQVLRDPYYV